MLILCWLSVQPAFAELDYKQLAATKKDQPAFVTTVFDFVITIQASKLEIPKGSEIRLLAVGADGNLRAQFNGNEFTIPAGVTDIEERVTEIRSKPSSVKTDSAPSGSEQQQITGAFGLILGTAKPARSFPDKNGNYKFNPSDPPAIFTQRGVKYFFKATPKTELIYCIWLSYEAEGLQAKKTDLIQLLANKYGAKNYESSKKTAADMAAGIVRFERGQRSIAVRYLHKPSVGQPAITHTGKINDKVSTNFGELSLTYTDHELERQAATERLELERARQDRELQTAKERLAQEQKKQGETERPKVEQKPADAGL